MSQLKSGTEGTRERGRIREDLLAPWYNYEDQHSASGSGDLDHWLHRRQDSLQFRSQKSRSEMQS